MNNKPNNPQAFPLAMPDQYHPEGAPLQQGFIDSGMTLRDYFAAKALASLILNEDFRWESGSITNTYCRAKVSFIAYELADAMLVEREKNQ